MKTWILLLIALSVLLDLACFVAYLRGRIAWSMLCALAALALSRWGCVLAEFATR